MTTSEQSMVVGLFDDNAQAEQAVNALRTASFRDDQITFSGHETSTGGILAGLKSLFSGKRTGESVYNDLVDSGLPEGDAHYYQQEYDAGRSIVAVTGGGRMQEAATILARYGGYGPGRRSAQTADVNTTATSAAAASQTAEDVAPQTTTQAPVSDTEGEQRIQLLEEQLQVYKRPVQTGEVSLRKEIVTEQKTLNVPFNREEVYIERQAVNQPLPADTTFDEQGQTIRVPVSEEHVNVGKQTVVREEIGLGKRIVQDTQQVNDTVRHEELRVEREGDIHVQDAGAQDIAEDD